MLFIPEQESQLAKERARVKKKKIKCKSGRKKILSMIRRAAIKSINRGERERKEKRKKELERRKEKKERKKERRKEKEEKREWERKKRTRK